MSRGEVWEAATTDRNGVRANRREITYAIRNGGNGLQPNGSTIYLCH